MPATSRYQIKVNDKITLELLAERHAEALSALVNSNRQHLREWLPWVDYMHTVEDFEAYIDQCQEQYDEGTDNGYVILWNKMLVGRIGIHHINLQNKLGAIGYWLGEAYQGKGIISKACGAMINHGFGVLNLNRLEIKCGTGNNKSKAIAERLQFKQEGILRQSEKLNNGFIDLYLYSLLKDEWKVKAG
ncbi:MAG: GNAT family N-acetyltransferase [Bacteroidota bacterium]|nr:GNAT family N-acetyltransferase [Bacteroidota bacterium]